MLKAIILIGGPMKGTRFRPLSLELPKPLFPLAGFPILYHHVEACSKLPELREIILIGFYQPNAALNKFISESQLEFRVQIRYLQEYSALGTAGGLYHFRDQIMTGAPEMFFVMNADVCGDFPLQRMLEFHKALPASAVCTMLATEATKQQSLNFGCIIENKDTHEVLHYVEKPETFVSASINCGIYLFTPEVFRLLEVAFKKNLEENYSNMDLNKRRFDFSVPSKEVIHFEQDLFVPMAATGALFVFQTTQFWSQIKNAGAAIFANRHYLTVYKRTHPERLAVNREGHPTVIGDVFIHPMAQVHPTAVLGPNVTVGKNAVIGEGVRVRESIVLEGTTLQDHCCILYSVIGWHSTVGFWTRVEGTPNDPNPDKAFAKVDIPSMFTDDGRLNPSITVIGSSVQVPSEVIVLNSIVLPHKDLNGCYKNQIIL